MKNKGFTLIELMIVIAIIAIIAAIAIPNLMESRISANETSAAASLRAYLNAQGTYHRTDWDEDGEREYAADVDLLYNIVGGGALKEPKLIDRSFAEADDDAVVAGGSTLSDNEARSGYLFHDILGYTADTGGNGWVDGFGLKAYPDVHGRTGRQEFVINEEGTVYSKDTGAEAGAAPDDAWPAVTDGTWLTVAE